MAFRVHTHKIRNPQENTMRFHVWPGAHQRYSGSFFLAPPKKSCDNPHTCKRKPVAHRASRRPMRARYKERVRAGWKEGRFRETRQCLYKRKVYLCLICMCHVGDIIDPSYHTRLKIFHCLVLIRNM